MEADFRVDFCEARDILAYELVTKHGLVESYRSDERLTLDGTYYSIHFTFIIPEEEMVRISLKGKQWFDGDTFMDLMYEKYVNLKDVKIAFKALISHQQKARGDSYTSTFINLSSMIYFMEIEHSDYFL